MSRLLSRFGVRALAVMLLLVGAAGGYYLGVDRQHQQQANPAQLAAQTERLPEEYQARTTVSDERRVAQQEATRRAAEAAQAEADRARKAEQAARKKRAAAESAKSTPTTKPYAGPIPASCKEYSGNRAIGCAILLDSGFKLDQMPCLDKLWTKESGWNHRATNASSGAYGIPQALPGSKMASVGDDWQSNPATQIKWGLGYIKGRYGTPCAAWSHLQNVGWY